MEVVAPATHMCSGGLAFLHVDFLCCQLLLSTEPRNGLGSPLHLCPHVLYADLIVDGAQGRELSARKLLLDLTRQQPEGWVSHTTEAGAIGGGGFRLASEERPSCAAVESGFDRARVNANNDHDDRKPAFFICIFFKTQDLYQNSRN